MTEEEEKKQKKEQIIQGIKQLAALMRKGAQLHPQTTHAYLKRNDDYQISTCALGAAWVGLVDEATLASAIYGINSHVEAMLHVLLGFDSNKILVVMPNTHEQESQKSLWFAITKLNDYDGWTRERIADWLDTLTIDDITIEE